MEAYQIVKQMHEAFPRLTKRLSRIAGKSEEWWNSHGRMPKTENPMQSGNKSPVTHYMEYLYQHEAAEPGAGQFLNNRVHGAMMAEFARDIEITQAEITTGILDEGCDVQKWLAQHDLHNASEIELLEFERECEEAKASLDKATAEARSIRRQMEITLAA